MNGFDFVENLVLIIYGCSIAVLALMVAVAVTAVFMTLFDIFLELEHKLNQLNALSASWRVWLQKAVLFFIFSLVLLLTLPTVLGAFGAEIKPLYVWQFYQMVIGSGAAFVIVLFGWLLYRFK